MLRGRTFAPLVLIARVRGPIPLYWGSFLLAGLALGILGPALSSLRERSGSTIAEIGNLFIAQAVGYLLGSLLGGRLFDRLSGHHVFAASLVVSGLGIASVTTQTSLSGLFGAFLVVGLGIGLCEVGANTLLIWRLGPRSGRSLNILHLCFGIGALSAPILVYIGLDRSLWGAGVAFVALAAWSLTVPSPTVRAATADQHPRQTSSLLGLLSVFFFVYVGLEVGFAGWIHTYALEVEFSELGATWVTSSFWVGFIAGRMISTALAATVRPKRVLIWACSISVVAAGVLLLTGANMIGIWIATVLLGLAAGPQYPVMLAYLERRIHITGSATAWFLVASGFGGLSFPWLIGRWFEASGSVALPWSILGLSLLTLGMFGVSNRLLDG